MPNHGTGIKQSQILSPFTLRSTQVEGRHVDFNDLVDLDLCRPLCHTKDTFLWIKYLQHLTICTCLTPVAVLRSLQPVVCE